MQSAVTLTEPMLVPDRCLIGVTGADALDFLQKLASNDLRLLAERDGIIYTLLLNAQGRYLYDFFIERRQGNIFIDAHIGQRDSLLALLQRYKLRAQVDFTVVDTQQLCLLPNGEFADPRQPGLGYREWRPASEGTGDYHNYRVARGIIEPAIDLQSGIDMPLEYALNSLNAISFSKGCYPGQELTARMHNRDQAKHKIVVLAMDGHAGEKIYAGETAVGKVVASRGGKIISQIRRDTPEGHLLLVRPA